MLFVLQAWPRARELFGDLNRIPVAPKIKGCIVAHDPVWVNGRWVCIKCFRSFKNCKRADASECGQHPPSLRALVAPPAPPSPAHDLRIARVVSTGLGCVFCKRCGAYTTGKAPKYLTRGCTNPKPQQISMLLNGRLPWPRGPKGRISRAWIPGALASDWGSLLGDAGPSH